MTPLLASFTIMKLTPKPLTAAEKKWIARANKLFAEAPDRFEFVTIGDPTFSVVDGDLVKKHDVELEDGGGEDAGVVLGHITLKGRMHGVAG
jgi:hypothetical protein